MIHSLVKKYPFFCFAVKRKVFLKFFVVGGFCGFLDLLLIYLFTDFLGFWYIYSGIISFILVSFVSFFLNSRLTFEDKSEQRKTQYLKYLIVLAGGITINNFFLFFFTEIFGIWYVVSRILSSLIALFWNYNLSKKLIFQKNEKGINNNTDL